MKTIKTLNQLKNHPLVNNVWKEFQDYQYDDCNYVFFLSLKSGYIFETEQSSMITTRGYVYEIIETFNLLINDIIKDNRQIKKIKIICQNLKQKKLKQKR